MFFNNGSFPAPATTQIYLHAADALRSAEMEKMQINLAPIKAKPSPSKIVKLQLELKGNNIIGATGLQFLLEFIAQHIFNGYSWQSEQTDLMVLSNYTHSINKEVRVVYSITNIQPAQLELISEQIRTAVEIRQLQCKITQDC